MEHQTVDAPEPSNTSPLQRFQSFSPPPRPRSTTTFNSCNESFCIYSEEENEVFLALARSVLDDDEEDSGSFSQFSLSQHSLTPSIMMPLAGSNDLQFHRENEEDDCYELLHSSFSVSSSYATDSEESLRRARNKRPLSRDLRRVVFTSVTVHEFRTDQSASTESTGITMSLCRHEGQTNRTRTHQQAEQRRAKFSKGKCSRSPPPLPVRTVDHEEQLQRHTEPVSRAA